MTGEGYVYVVRLAPTAITAAKTLIQIKAGAAPIAILEARVYQVTKTSSELLALQLIQYTGSPTAGTVTSATPVPINPSDPAALAVGSTSATGVNASAEPSGGNANIITEGVWNVLNGEWSYLPVPEGRERIAQSKLFGLKLNTAPAASMTIGGYVKFIEYQ